MGRLESFQSNRMMGLELFLIDDANRAGSQVGFLRERPQSGQLKECYSPPWPEEVQA